MVTNSMIKRPKVCVFVAMSASDFDEFLALLVFWSIHLRLPSLGGGGVICSEVDGTEAQRSSEAATGWRSLRSSRAFLTATNEAAINLTGVSRWH